MKTSSHVIPGTTPWGAWKGKDSLFTNSHYCLNTVVQQVFTLPAVWPASTGKHWDILSIGLLRRKEMTCPDLLRVGCFTPAGHSEQEQVPLGKSILLLLIVLSFIYLSVSSVRMCCTAEEVQISLIRDFLSGYCVFLYIFPCKSKIREVRLNCPTCSSLCLLLKTVCHSFSNVNVTCHESNRPAVLCAACPNLMEHPCPVTP